MSKRLKQFIEIYAGSSFPTRSETTDGEICVVKMRGAGNGDISLLSEFIVNRLGSRAGLAIPDASIIDIPARFPWRFGTDEFDDLVQKSAGANLALEWIKGATVWPADRYKDLPDELVSQITTLDLVFANVDRTKQSMNLLTTADGRFWIVDHGSCRFLMRNETPAFQKLPSGHVFSDRTAAYDRRWLAPITSALIRETAAEIPEAWLHSAGLTRDQIARKIEARLSL